MGEPVPVGSVVVHPEVPIHCPTSTERTRDVIGPGSVPGDRMQPPAAISAFLTLDLSAERLCAEEPFLARYPRVRFSTVRRIRAAGFALLPTLERPHYDVVLPDDADETLGKVSSRPVKTRTSHTPGRRCRMVATAGQHTRCRVARECGCLTPPGR